ncbi:MAG: sialidase family protein [Pseudonocardiales bacterium]
MRLSRLTVVAAAVAVTMSPIVALASPSGGDSRVSIGSPATPFPQNKQNEPGLAVDPRHPNVLASGSNDEIDLAPCHPSATSPCPFTPGVGVSGVYFSTTSGAGWVQPTYTGYSARTGTGTYPGPIGTLPRYYEHGLVSGGDPELAFGPKPLAGGGFSRSESRLYYATLASNFPGKQAFSGAEAAYVSRTDNVAGAAAGDKSAWMAPVLVSRQNAALFSDKESIAADYAQTSRHYGNVYICNVGFRGNGQGNATPEPVLVARSTNGGDSWTQTQVSAATNNGQTGGRQGCAVRTDSHGTVVLVYSGFSKQLNSGVFYQQRSYDGGATFSRPQVVAVTAGIGQLDPVQGRYTIDGVAGARTDVFPSLDIANGAPTGTDATNEILLSWSDDSAGQNNETAYLEYSTNGGNNYSAPTAISTLSEGRANQPAIAISPNGNDAYLTYNGYLQDWQPDTSTARMMHGVVRHADIGARPGLVPGTFTTVHVGAEGDARGASSNGLSTEFLGDYNYAVATNTYGAAVWNDVRNAQDCPAIDAYRQLLVLGTPPSAKPFPPTACAAAPDFGNSDIYGGGYPDPTP